MGNCFGKAQPLVPEPVSGPLPPKVKRAVFLCPPGLPEAHSGSSDPATSLMGMVLTDGGRSEQHFSSGSSGDEMIVRLKDSTCDIIGLELHLRSIGASRDSWSLYINEQSKANCVIFVVDRTTAVNQVNDKDHFVEREKQEKHFAALAKLLVDIDSNSKYSYNIWGGESGKEALKTDYFSNLAEVVMSHSLARASAISKKSAVQLQEEEYFNALSSLDLPLLVPEFSLAEFSVDTEKNKAHLNVHNSSQLQPELSPTSAKIIIAELFSTLPEDNAVNKCKLSVTQSPRSSIRSQHVHVDINMCSGMGVRELVALISES